MKIDGGIMGALSDVGPRARDLEARGFDGGMTAEVSNDPFLPLALAAEHTDTLELFTGIAVAFARSPMTVAHTAHDLNTYAKGRFILGLGSQVRPHITRRFSMPWSRPAARMREYVHALRAIWASWYDDARLDFQGDFYTHTLMTPMFTPTDRSAGPPRIMIAGVNPRMTEVAGEVADGFVAHGFTTPDYMREVTVPAIARGLERAGRRRGSFELFCPVFVVTGATEPAMAAARETVRAQVAFYGSTPAYHPVLERLGWTDLATELHTLSRAGRWADMTRAVDDTVLGAFAVIAEPADVAAGLIERYGDVVDRVLWTASLPPESEATTLAAIQAARPAHAR